MNNYFKFETDFRESLNCIPLKVRLNLDTCGVKLKLNHWLKFTLEERKKLVNMPCETSTEINNYRNFLQQLVINKTGSSAKEIAIEDNPEWLQEDHVPETVNHKAAEFKVNLSVEQWKNLTKIQRFALIKLSRSGHENKNFYPALKEFELLESEII
jgi:hypothetical protein